MGFSLTATWAIIGACAIIIIELLSTLFFPLIVNVDESTTHNNVHMLDLINTKFNLQNISLQPNGSTTDLHFQLNNTGQSTLDLSQCNLLIDGAIATFSYTQPYLFPQETTTLHATNLTIAQPTHIKMVTGNGAESYTTYPLGGN